MKIEISSLLAFGCLLCAGPSSVAAQEFYAGKTITIVVGAAAGGGFDTYARLFARHMPKHIPGRPATVGQNMPGAGILVAAKYTVTQAKAA